VFVAASAGEAHYSTFLGSNETGFHMQMKAKFGRFFHGGSLKVMTDWTTLPHLLDNWKVYRTDDTDETARKERLSNHINQFKRASECFNLIYHAEHAMQTNYTTVIKLRDDSVVLKPMTRLPQAASNHVVVKGCNWYGGVEDKVAIMPRAYADDYLQGPYDFQMQVLKSAPTEVEAAATLTSSEEMLNKVLELRHVQIDPAETEDFPVVDGRPSSDRQGFCVVPNKKDCHPQEPWAMDVNICTPDEMFG